jgi:hypothetical protein
LLLKTSFSETSFTLIRCPISFAVTDPIVFTSLKLGNYYTPRAHLLTRHKFYVASLNTMLNTKLTGSHSCRYFDTCLFFISFHIQLVTCFYDLVFLHEWGTN